MSYHKYKKSFKTKKKKSPFRILRNPFFWIALLFSLITIGILYFFFLSSFFKIEEVRIEGNVKVKTERIRKIVEEHIDQKILFVIPKNLLLVKLKTIDSELLEKFPRIRKVEIKRDLPRSIIVNIEERFAIGVWCRPIEKQEEDPEGDEEVVLVVEDDCFQLDDGGTIFERKVKDMDLVIKSDKEVKISDKVINEEDLEDIIDIKEKLNEVLDSGIKDFFVPSEEGKLIARTNEGWEIYLNSLEDMEPQVINLGLVLKEKIPSEERGNLEYINLRFGNRVYFRYIGEAPIDEESPVDLIDED